MNKYDKWKLDMPDELENECAFCGNLCSDTYCSDYCRKGDYYENLHD